MEGKLQSHLTAKPMNNIALPFRYIEVTDESDTANIQLTPLIIREKKRLSFISVI